MNVIEAGTRRWSRDEFIRAWDVGEFEHRVELIDGEIWPVPIDNWPARTTFDIAALLSHPGVRLKPGFLPSGESLPVPNCWVCPRYAKPVAPLGRQMSTWDPADVLLVVEVTDDNILRDLEIKARIYGAAGWPVYWVVTPTVIYEHIKPYNQGYRKRMEYRPGEAIPVHYANTQVDIDDLIVPIR